MALQRDWAEETTELPGSHLTVVAPVAPRPFVVGRPVAARRAARARMLQRRRRSALAAGAVLSLVVLIWPGHAFGGMVGSADAMGAQTQSRLSAGMVYVVQRGDTVTSIARLIDPANPASARLELVRELRSSVVVVGEHVAIP